MTVIVNIGMCCLACNLTNVITKLIVSLVLVRHPELSDKKVKYITHMFA